MTWLIDRQARHRAAHGAVRVIAVSSPGAEFAVDHRRYPRSDTHMPDWFRERLNQR